jgi:hypothetical protein
MLALPQCPPRLAHEASEALAIHHEHRLRDHRAAHRFALESLQFASGSAQMTGVRHRLTRLERKMTREVPPVPSPLFNS